MFFGMKNNNIERKEMLPKISKLFLCGLLKVRINIEGYALYVGVQAGYIIPIFAELMNTNTSFL